MAILRKVKKSDFTVIDNNVFKNKDLSYKAKGLLCTMLSLPDDWNFSEDGLSSLSSDGISSVRTTLKELMDFGYLERTRARDDKGILRDTVYTIYEEPTLENPNLDKPILENLKTYKELNNKELKDKKEIYKESFEKLWKLYPNKKGKESAYKSFVKAMKDGVSLEEVEKGIEKYKFYIETKCVKPEYIKYGSTWFNQKCWEDDYEIEASKEKLPQWFNKNVELEEVDDETRRLIETITGA